MTRRFQIEDLICQDGSGVIFRALDTQSGREVALRRFFPFGASGGGLQEDEKTAYRIAAGRLARLHHPALRAVVAGGCDPVDGIPFLAAEWIEGETLESVMAGVALRPEAAAALLDAALEVSELLSQVLAEEAVWVETDLRTIIVGSAESGRGFTFWISPLKWLGTNDPTRGLESIVKLAEEALDWQNRVVGEQSGHGLGAWFNWLRSGATATASLREARENLAAAIGAEPPRPVKHLLAAATRAPAGKSRRSKVALGVTVSLAVAACAAGGWLLTRPMAGQSTHALEITSPGEMERRVNPRAASTAELAARITAQQADAAANDGIISAGSRELLHASGGEMVRVEGVVRAIRKSKSGKTCYLHFAPLNDAMATRAAIRAGDSPGGLEAFVGSTVRVTGKVKASENSAPEIILAGPDAILRLE